MISRVTHTTMQRSTLGNLQLNLRSMSDLQARLSSGKMITKASDDPGAASRVMNLRAEQAAVTQAKRNADGGVSWLTQLDSTMQSSIDVLHRVRELTVRGANSTTAGGPAVEAIATELEGLRDSMLGLANTTLGGRAIFAGTSPSGAAFDGPGGVPPYQWHGTPGAEVTRRIGPDAAVRIDVAGPDAYGEGAASVFQLIDDIAADLRAGTPVTARLDEIDGHLETMLSTVTGVGVRHKQMMEAQSSLEHTLQELKSSISGIEDIDLAQTVIELEMQEIAYQGALGATARVLQPTLMDFLR